MRGRCVEEAAPPCAATRAPRVVPAILGLHAAGCYCPAAGSVGASTTTSCASFAPHRVAWL